MKDDFEIKANGDYYIRKRGLWQQYHTAKEFIEKHADYKIGETVYLKETFCILFWDKYKKTVSASYSIDKKLNTHIQLSEIQWDKFLLWKNKSKDRSGRFMPEWASRKKLLITGIGIERLQDISVEDCIAEGVIKVDYIYGGHQWRGNNCQFFAFPQDAFASIWDSINKKYKWDSNPFVFRYEFKKGE